VHISNQLFCSTDLKNANSIPKEGNQKNLLFNGQIIKKITGEKNKICPYYKEYKPI
jgi:hypothetical protein